MNNYKNSNARLVLLLVQLFGISYTILAGDETASFLAICLVPLWIYSVKTWSEKDEI